jgi:hypothetical protein
VSCDGPVACMAGFIVSPMSLSGSPAARRIFDGGLLPQVPGQSPNEFSMEEGDDQQPGSIGPHRAPKPAGLGQDSHGAGR